MNSETEIKEIARAFEKLKEAPTIPVYLDADAGFLLLAQLQLALRHPANQGQSAKVIRDFAISLQQLLTDICPEIGEVLEKGWDSQYDQKVQHWARYQDLQPQIQEEVLLSSFGLNLASVILSKLTGHPVSVWIQTLSEEANNQLQSMSSEDAIKLIK